MPILPVVVTLELLLRHRLNISRAASPVGGQARNCRKMLNGLASQKDQAQLTYTTEPATEPSSVKCCSTSKRFSAVELAPTIS